MNVMTFSVLFLLILLYVTILLASVIYCSNEFYESAQQHGHADHLLGSETQRWNNKVWYCCLRPWAYEKYIARKHPGLSTPSVYAQVVVLLCDKLDPDLQNEKEKTKYGSILIALLFPLVCRNPWDHQSWICNTLLNGYFFSFKASFNLISLHLQHHTFIKLSHYI